MDTSPPLEAHRIPGPDAAYYIPNFVSIDEEAYLLRKIQETPHTKWRQLANRRLQTWGGDLTPKNTLIPQPFPAFVTQFPDLLTRLECTGAFADSPHKRPNHIILNEYLPGQGIMPHEDGPSYHPVVATLSLGSHAVFHYYQYKPDGPTVDDTDAAEQSPIPTAKGRAIDPTPALSVLLEQRSLVITTSALYTGGLHGIDGVQADAPESTGRAGVRIANAHMLAGDHEREIVLRGGTLERGARYSLTCRDVGRVSGLGPRGVLGRSR
ncbi:hypothetical protein DENSPDRAFT_781161 [Dentipellis sp. KUC8613]|nr:hypothetical protein DENSPDRAFT_781161 [Dentipellis sp. KUC8613]